MTNLLEIYLYSINFTEIICILFSIKMWSFPFFFSILFYLCFIIFKIISNYNHFCDECRSIDSSTSFKNDCKTRWRNVVHSDKIFPLKMYNQANFIRNFYFDNFLLLANIFRIIKLWNSINIRKREIFYFPEPIKFQTFDWLHRGTFLLL